MNDLKSVAGLVKSILEDDPQCRNSDSFLYLKVLTVIGQQKGIELEKMTVPFFLLNLHGAGLPGFETVRRARQKIQAAHPELSACDRVEGFRAAQEQNFRAFAAGDC